MHQVPPTLSPFVIKACKNTCPNAVLPHAPRVELEQVVHASGWPDFLHQTVTNIRHHHQFKIAVSGCPNGCAQPHIADFGLIATAKIHLDPDLCKECGLCITACREQALNLGPPITLDAKACLGCLACVRVCSTQALTSPEALYRVVLGGKLGRHPRLAHELGEFNVPQVLVILEKTLALYMQHYRPRLRLGELVEHLGVENVNALVGP